jgi:hypothetical protein
MTEPLSSFLITGVVRGVPAIIDAATNPGLPGRSATFVDMGSPFFSDEAVLLWLYACAPVWQPHAGKRKREKALSHAHA